MGHFFRGLFGGGGGERKKERPIEIAPAPAPAPEPKKAEPKKLFTPQQAEQVSKRYGQSAEAKWRQIMAGMGAGGPQERDISTGISSQAKALTEELGKLTSESGFGETTPDIMGSFLEGPLSNILKAIESQLGEKGQAKYKLF